jgi:putative FmdB family regulatory protein
MPVYEYLCAECGHRFEQYRKVTNRTPKQCPKCQGSVKKVFRPLGIIFKGSGFYSTDSRSPSDKAREKSESSSPSRAGGKKSDDKAREKSESSSPSGAGVKKSDD